MLGYDTLCRGSELVGLRVEDLDSPFRESAQILIGRSKTDPYGEGRLGYVSPETLTLLCSWLKAAEIDSGYIFRAVHGNWISNRALHPYSINRILKRTARASSSSNSVLLILCTFVA
jgi:integrase/recombinase XerD